MTKKKLPNYDVILTDNNMGLMAISLVEKPAIGMNFVYLSEDEQVKPDKIEFKLSDEEKGEAIGAVLVPNKPILRVINGQAFYITFSEEVIRQINERMHKYGTENYFTVSHEMPTNKVTLLESWIKETEEDKSNAFGFDAPIGTLFAKVKIDSDFLKKNIKDGNLKGFSAELDVSIVESKKINQEKQDEMKFSEMYENSVTVDGKTILYNGELEKGTVLFELKEEDEKQNIVPVNFDFSINNVNYKVKDGLVVEVEDIELSLSEKIDTLMGEINGIKAKLEEMREKSDGDEKDELVESVNTVLQKLEEQSLLAKQKDSKNEGEKIDLQEQEFSVEAYEIASKWADRFADNK